MLLLAHLHQRVTTPVVAPCSPRWVWRGPTVLRPMFCWTRWSPVPSLRCRVSTPSSRSLLPLVFGYRGRLSFDLLSTGIVGYSFLLRHVFRWDRWSLVASLCLNVRRPTVLSRYGKRHPSLSCKDGWTGSLVVCFSLPHLWSFFSLLVRWVWRPTVHWHAFHWGHWSLLLPHACYPVTRSVVARCSLGCRI